MVSGLVHPSKAFDGRTRRHLPRSDLLPNMGRRHTSSVDRRTVLAAVGSGAAVALAGCGGDGDDGGSPTDDGTPTDAVPQEYATATAIAGNRRDPDALATKNAVKYQSEPSGGSRCSGCAYYIPDKNDDGMGACAIVEGTIDPSGYCTSYVAHEESTATDAAGGSETVTAAEAVAVPDDAECAVCGMAPAEFPAWNAQALHADDTRAFFCTSGCATTYHAVTEQFADTDAEVVGLWVRDLHSEELIDGRAAHFALETDQSRLDDPMRLNPAPFASRSDAVEYVDAVDYLGESDVVELSAFGREEAELYRGNLLD